MFLIPSSEGCDNDLDNDGIDNRLDLDSDGDGCPDAVEGDAGISENRLVDSTINGGNTNGDPIENPGTDFFTTSTSKPVVENLGDVVDENGVPVVANGGQDVGTSKDATTSNCTDTDNDGVNDYNDIDKDNDGVLDVVENCVLAPINIIDGATTWPSDTPGLTVTVSTSASGSNASIVTNSTATFFNVDTQQITEYSDAVQINADVESNTSVITYTFSQAIAADELGLFIEDIDRGSPTGSISVSGGTATTSDFHVQRVIRAGKTAISPVFSLNNNTGDIIFPSDLSGSNRISAVLAGITDKTFTKLVLTINNLGVEGTLGDNARVFLLPILGCDNDIDNDGVDNNLDLDSDGDGCPDLVESGIPTAVQASGTSATDGITDNTDSAVINVSKDTVETNGFAGSLESADTNTATTTKGYTTTNYSTYAKDNTINGCGIPMITQVYWKGAEKIIEITNIDPVKVLVPQGINLNFFDEGTTTARTASWVNTAEISANTSMLFVNTASVNAETKSGVSTTEDANIVAFNTKNDIITISRNGEENTSLAWDSRIDVLEKVIDSTSFVRIDETLSPNTTYTESEWVAFVNDALNPYQLLDQEAQTGGPERHPHAPLLSEVTAGVNVEANILLGLHRFNPTTRTGAAWDNGYPDRSRHVKVLEDYNHSGSPLSARKLAVNNNSKLAVTDSLLVVTNSITLTNTNDEIRLVGAAQLVQTHTGTTQVSGNGKLLVEQNSTVPSVYRYNYFSSPVNTIGGSTFTVESVLKDGTVPVDAATEIYDATDNTKNLSTNIARDIYFIDGYDGKFAKDSLFIADYWVYTYASSGAGRSNWSQKKKNGTIAATDGFIMKGPGRAQNYTFLGTAKDGALTTSIGANESYLVGNPFSSAISIKKFIEDNIATTTGTLYFWQHAGEDDTSTDTSGHNYRGYVGGYGTRNISMGVAANSETALVGFDISLEAEGAFLHGSVVTDGSVTAISLSNTGDFVQFKNLIKGVDTLKIKYKSAEDKKIIIKVNGGDRGKFTLPSSTEYTIFDIALCVEKGSDLSIVSNDTNISYIDYLQLKDADGETSCEPSTSESDDFKEPAPYIPIGQGFFIQGSEVGGAIEFNNSQREFQVEQDTVSIFFRGSKKSKTSLALKKEKHSYQLPIIKLGMDYLNEQGVGMHRRIGISFNKALSFGYDKGYDSETYDLGATDIYWKFPNEALSYTIAGVQEVSETLEVPFDIVMDYTGSIILKIDQVKRIGNHHVFIKDNFTHKTYSLNNNVTAAFQLEKGLHTERFSLVFKNIEAITNKTLSVEDDIINKYLTVFVDGTSNEIVIQNKGNVILSKVELFNLLGQQISEWNTIDNALENRLKVKHLSKNMYIINIKTDKGILSKKVVLE